MDNPVKWQPSADVHHGAMSATVRRADRGAALADQYVHDLGRELRDLRVGAGLSQSALAAAVGMSASHVSRAERGLLVDLPLRHLCLLFAVLGQRLRVRPYPEDSPLRDMGYVKLLERFRLRLPPSVKLRTEVPLRRYGDLRAWDGELDFGRDTCKLEAETAVADLQATDRRIGLKMDDDGVDRVILLVSDTRRNRLALRQGRELLRGRFPLDAREILSAVGRGICPPAGGIVML